MWVLLCLLLFVAKLHTCGFAQSAAVGTLDSCACLTTVRAESRRSRAGGARLCGRMNEDRKALPFIKRLSSQCRATLSKYLIVPETIAEPRRLHYRLQRVSAHNATADGSFDAYQFWDAALATNPVVVRGTAHEDFVVCTGLSAQDVQVPKAGCTQFRSLLYVLTRCSKHPMTFKNGHVHEAQYPTLHHYHNYYSWHGAESHPLPSFVLGRNPYVRLLSAFLDKLVPSESNFDWAVYKRVYNELGRTLSNPFADTPESFREFVRLLAGTPVRNQHFVAGTDVCAMREVPYRYALRLEDMAQWYPCFVDGLNLTDVVEHGWLFAANGTTSYAAHHPGCWFAPKSQGCDAYRAETQSAAGAVPGPWEAGVAHRDAHDSGSADKYRRYYDERTAALVYDMYRDDFVVFKYDRESFRPGPGFVRYAQPLGA